MKEKATYYLVTDEGEIREINITFEKYHKMLHDKKQNVFYYESDAEAYAKKCKKEIRKEKFAAIRALLFSIFAFIVSIISLIITFSRG
jgi:vacuolar-type H+-ATPase subunit D/Vma8